MESTLRDALRVARHELRHARRDRPAITLLVGFLSVLGLARVSARLRALVLRALE